MKNRVASSVLTPTLQKTKDGAPFVPFGVERSKARPPARAESAFCVISICGGPIRGRVARRIVAKPRQLVQSCSRSRVEPFSVSLACNPSTICEIAPIVDGERLAPACNQRRRAGCVGLTDAIQIVVNPESPHCTVRISGRIGIGKRG